MLSNAKDMLDKATGTFEATVSLNESFASFNEAMTAFPSVKNLEVMFLLQVMRTNLLVKFLHCVQSFKLKIELLLPTH